jgi:hypothetical protein
MKTTNGKRQLKRDQIRGNNGHQGSREELPVDVTWGTVVEPLKYLFSMLKTRDSHLVNPCNHYPFP